VNGDVTCFDHDKLHEITQVITRNLNKIIDENYYPVEGMCGTQSVFLIEAVCTTQRHEQAICATGRWV
jgi:hypothetical protein